MPGDRVKLTTPQRAMLQELAEGRAIFTVSGPRPVAFFGGTMRTANWNTLEACRVRGWIAAAYEEVSGPTYRITDAGRAALQGGGDHDR